MKSNIKIVFDPASRISWAVRLILKGERYGRNDVLVNDGDAPLVEFYDTRHGHTDLGQFVSRYEVGTVLEHRYGLEGILLDTGSPDWTLSNIALIRVQKWLQAQTQTLRLAA